MTEGWYAFDPEPVHAVVVIGYDGSPLTGRAADALAEASLVIGGARHLAAVSVPAAARTIVLGPVEVALQEAVQACRREPVVVLASGDPGFFGIVRALRRAGATRLEVIPAPSSIATAAARLGVPWDDAVVVSAHGRPPAPALNAWRRWAPTPTRVVMLTDATTGPVALMDALGADFDPFQVLERLGEQDERITQVHPAYGRVEDGIVDEQGARARAWQEPLLLVSMPRRTPEVAPVPWMTGPPPIAGWGLPDEAFAHRDGMLTKRDVRALVLSRLAPAPGTLVWDIGSGSGSVAVECSRLGSAAIAVERADTSFIEANAKAHDAPVRVVRGQAPEALAGLPQPDAVFVGGGGPEVVRAAAAVRPARLVVALATLERVAPTVAALDGYDVDTVLAQVSSLQPLGEGTRLVPANPVFVVSGVLK